MVEHQQVAGDNRWSHRTCGRCHQREGGGAVHRNRTRGRIDPAPGL